MVPIVCDNLASQLNLCVNKVLSNRHTLIQGFFIHALLPCDLTRWLIMRSFAFGTNIKTWSSLKLDVILTLSLSLSLSNQLNSTINISHLVLHTPIVSLLIGTDKLDRKLMLTKLECISTTFIVYMRCNSFGSLWLG